MSTFKSPWTLPATLLAVLVSACVSPRSETVALGEHAMGVSLGDVGPVVAISKIDLEGVPTLEAFSPSKLLEKVFLQTFVAGEKARYSVSQSGSTAIDIPPGTLSNTFVVAVTLVPVFRVEGGKSLDPQTRDLPVYSRARLIKNGSGELEKMLGHWETQMKDVHGSAVDRLSAMFPGFDVFLPEIRSQLNDATKSAVIEAAKQVSAPSVAIAWWGLMLSDRIIPDNMLKGIQETQEAMGIQVKTFMGNGEDTAKAMRFAHLYSVHQALAPASVKLFGWARDVSAKITLSLEGPAWSYPAMEKTSFKWDIKKVSLWDATKKRKFRVQHSVSLSRALSEPSETVPITFDVQYESANTDAKKVVGKAE